jgi:fatty-acid peroxygenase
MLQQDLGSVAVLDGEEHRHRKAMFLSLMTPDGITAATEAFAEQWRAAVGRWAKRDTVVLHHAVEEVLFRAACAWVGVPLPEAAAYRRTRQLTAMIEGAGSPGPRMWRGMLLRMRAEAWIRDMIERVRAGTLAVPEGCPIQVVAGHRERDGRPLDTATAAVEVINLLSPTVAVARYVTFAAMALHEHPE